MCMCVCVRTCVHACVRVRVCAHVSTVRCHSEAQTQSPRPAEDLRHVNGAYYNVYAGHVASEASQVEGEFDCQEEGRGQTAT